MQSKRTLLPEECVTFQVALIGSDGLVVGSDRLSNRLTRDDANENPTIEDGRQEKYLKSDDGSLVCFFAGDSTCQNVASSIAMHCSGNSRTDLTWTAAVRSRANSVGRIPWSIGDQLLVVRRHIPNAVWVVVRHPAGATFVTEYKEQAVCIGNNALAKFLPTHLWNSGLAIPQLKKLALLTLAYAAKENPGSVGPPYDVMSLDKNQKFEWSQHQSGDAIFAEFDAKLRTAFDQTTNF
jgi:hypothetical protein